MKYSRWFIGAVCQHASMAVMPRNHGQRGSQLPRYQHRPTIATLPTLGHVLSRLHCARSGLRPHPCHATSTAPQLPRCPRCTTRHQGFSARAIVPPHAPATRPGLSVTATLPVLHCQISGLPCTQTTTADTPATQPALHHDCHAVRTGPRAIRVVPRTQ